MMISEEVKRIVCGKGLFFVVVFAVVFSVLYSCKKPGLSLNGGPSSPGTNDGGKEPNSVKTPDTTPPGKVTNAKAEIIRGTRNVRLSWADPSDEDLAHIIISWSPPGGSTPQPMKIDKGLQEAVIENMDGGRNYRFKLNAFDNADTADTDNKDAVANESGSVEVMIFMLDRIPPAQVTGFSINATNNEGEAILSWTNPTDSDFETVEIGWTPNDTLKSDDVKDDEGNLISMSSPHTLPAGFSRIVLKNLQTKEYRFVIKALDNAKDAEGRPAPNASSETVAVPFTPPDRTAPEPVSNFVLTKNNINGKLELSWINPVADFDHVEITIQNQGNPISGSPVISTGTTLNTATAAGINLVNETLYTFIIVVVDAAGNKSASQSSDGTPTLPTADIIPPGEVSGFVVTPNGEGKVDLSWTEPGDSDFRNVLITYEPGGESATRIDKGTTSHSVTGLTARENNALYTFKIRTVDTSSNSSTGETKTAVPVDTTAPSEVTGHRVKGTGNGSVTLEWTNPSNGDFAKVLIEYNNGGNQSEEIDKSAQSEKTITGLTGGETYTFTIKTIDFKNNKSTGVNVQGTPPDNTPPSDVGSDPDNPTFEIVPASGQLTLNWVDPSNPDFKHVSISYSPGGGSEQQVNKGIQTYTITGLTNGESYSVTIKAVDNANNSSVGVVISGVPNDPEATILRLTDASYYADPFPFTADSMLKRKGLATKGTFGVRGNPGAAWPFGMTQMALVNVVTSSVFSNLADSGNANNVANGGNSDPKSFWTYTGEINRTNTTASMKGLATQFVTGPGCQLSHEFPFMFEPGTLNSDFLGDRVQNLRDRYQIQNPYKTTSNDSAKRERRDNSAQEYAEPGYYRAPYIVQSGQNGGILTLEATATPRTGFVQVTFPSDVNSATVFLTAFDAVLKTHPNSRNIEEASHTNTIYTTIRGHNFCKQKSLPMTTHAAFVFNKSFTFTRKSDRAQARLVFTFAEGETRVIKVKIGRSTVSGNKAYENVLAEHTIDSSAQSPDVYQNHLNSLGGSVASFSYNNLVWDFNLFRRLSYAAWNVHLSRLSVLDEEGTTSEEKRNHRLEEKRIFYSAFYQTSLHPNLASDYDGGYLGFDDEIHRIDSNFQSAQFQNYSGWDTYRGQHQLISFVNKKLASDVAQSLLNNAYHAGACSNPQNGIVRPDLNDVCLGAGAAKLTRWGYLNQETGVMNGDPGSILLTSSLALGGKGFDHQRAFKILSKSYGFVPFHEETVGSGGTKYLARSSGNWRLMQYSADNGGTVDKEGLAILPKYAKHNVSKVGHTTNMHEYAASDFAKAQFLNIISKEFPEKVDGSGDDELPKPFTASTVQSVNPDNTTGSAPSVTVPTTFEALYRDLMNHSGDAWKKAYGFYKARGIDNYVVMEMNGTKQTQKGSTRLNIEFLRSGTQSNVAATWNKWHSLINNFNTQGYSATTGNVPEFCYKSGCGNDNVIGGYREGEPEHYTYMVPFDVLGILKRVGPVGTVAGTDNKADADRKLERFRPTGDSVTTVQNDDTDYIRSNYHRDRLKKFIHYGSGSNAAADYIAGEHSEWINFGNQPSYTSPYALNYTGYAGLAQMTIRRIMNQIFDDQMKYSGAGNDDLGALSSQYVWSAIGLYSAHPGLGILHIVSPRFKKLVVRDEGNRVLAVLTAKSEGTDSSKCSSSKNYNNECFLIDSMTLNGSNYTKLYLRYYKDIEAAIASGGHLTLDFNLHRVPNKAIGNLVVTNGYEQFAPTVYNSNADRDSFYGGYENWQSSTGVGQRLGDLPPSGSGGITREQDYLYYRLIETAHGNQSLSNLAEGISESEHNDHGKFIWSHDYY